MLKDSKHSFAGVLFLAILREKRSFDARFSGALPLMFRLRGRRLCALRVHVGFAPYVSRMGFAYCVWGVTPCVSCAGD